MKPLQEGGRPYIRKAPEDISRAFVIKKAVEYESSMAPQFRRKWALGCFLRFNVAEGII
jgi:hypothetical protein